MEVLRPNRPLLAAAWMAGAVVSFAAMAVAGREIQAEMNTFELMLYRSVIGFLTVCLILARSTRGFAQIRTDRPWLHVQRNVVHYAGQNLWFFAVMLIPLGQLAAIEFTNPLWVALLAPLMLGEALTRARILAALIGFAGVVVVAQPGATTLGIGHAAALLAALLFALNTIFTSRIMRVDGVLCVLFWMTLSQSAFSLPLAVPGGIPWPSLALMPWVVVVSLAGLSAHFSLTSALGHAPASVVAPMEFARLPVLALLGAWLYAEPLRPAVFLGAGLIIAGNFINLRASAAGSRSPA